MPRLATEEEVEEEEDDDDDPASGGGGVGSVLGASLLFAGTAVGAGAVALPAETADTGFVPLTLGLLLS